MRLAGVTEAEAEELSTPLLSKLAFLTAPAGRLGLTLGAERERGPVFWAEEKGGRGGGTGEARGEGRDEGEGEGVGEGVGEERGGGRGSGREGLLGGGEGRGRLMFGVSFLKGLETVLLSSVGCSFWLTRATVDIAPAKNARGPKQPGADCRLGLIPLFSASSSLLVFVPTLTLEVVRWRELTLEPVQVLIVEQKRTPCDRGVSGVGSGESLALRSYKGFNHNSHKN